MIVTGDVGTSGLLTQVTVTNYSYTFLLINNHLIFDQAICEGRWLLLEYIDHAPIGGLSMLVPVTESSMLNVPDHGGGILAVPENQFVEDPLCEVMLLVIFYFMLFE